MAAYMTFLRRFLFILTALVLIHTNADVLAAPNVPLTVSANRSEQGLGGHLSFVIDPNEKLSINDVSNHDNAIDFTPLSGDIPHLGRTEGAVWLRFSLTNQTGKNLSRFLVYGYPVTDFVTLYRPGPKGHHTRLISGDTSTRSPEVVPNRLIIFPLELKPKTTTTYYMRLKSTGDMAFPLSVWEPTAFFRSDHWSQMGHGLFFGCCMGFIIYFFVIAWRLHSSPAGWFVAYVLMIALLMGFRQGFAQEIMGQSLRHYNNLVHLFVIAFLYFTGAKFLREFLGIKKYAPKADMVIRVLQWMGIFFIPMAIFNNPLTPIYSLILIGIGPWFSTGTALFLWVKGVPHARYFTIGWLIGHITSTIDFLRITGAMPYLEFTDTMMPLALISAMTCYTIALVEKTREYKLQSDMDTLTGLANRRKFDQHFAEEWNRNHRYQRPISLIMADVDCFKDYNDNYGHSAGDVCLKSVAKILMDNARRPGDLVARYGGEEFILCLPETDLVQAKAVAESIRQQVSDLNIKHDHSSASHILTLSLGVASTTPHEKMSPIRLIEQADRAMYEAKQKGRNRVASFVTAMTSFAT